jgi:hypothetical protein
MMLQEYEKGGQARRMLLQKWIVNDRDSEAISVQVMQDTMIMIVFVGLGYVSVYIASHVQGSML